MLYKSYILYQKKCVWAEERDICDTGRRSRSDDKRKPREQLSVDRIQLDGK